VLNFVVVAAVVEGRMYLREAPQILGFMDCAEAQSQRTYINNMNSRNSGRYMDMVSSSYPVVSSCGSFISPVPTGTNIVQNFLPLIIGGGVML
jgi:hypothetical protein